MFEIAKTADRLRQHAHHAGQLQRRRRRNSVWRPDRRRRRRPVRHDRRAAALTATARCSRSPRPSTGYASTPTTLVSFNGANGAVSRCRPDRRRQRRPVRHDHEGGADGGTPSQTARCSRSPRPRPATQARPPRWSASTALTAKPPGRPDRRRRRRPVRHDQRGRH